MRRLSCSFTILAKEGDISLLAHSRPAQFIVLCLFLIAGVSWFVRTWFMRANIPHNFGERPIVFDYLLMAVLTLILLHPVLMFIFGWIMTGLVALIPEKPAPTAFPPVPLRVAIITTYVAKSEPLEVLSRTLKSMIQAKDPEGWSHDVWVLDERVDQQDGYRVERMCRLLGVKYYSRQGIQRYNRLKSQFTPKTKGGNHNAWYDAYGFDNYDIVAQFDTDFSIRKNTLLKILPHFSDPRVGWVGTPQVYTNIHHFVARGAGEQTFGFFGFIMKGFSRFGGTLLIGANHTIRVAALKSIFGYDPHLTEDLATGMELHAHGWKSRYIAEQLADGEGPTTMPAYLKQQFRWAKGCTDLLLTSSMRRVSTMPVHQRVAYIWLQLHYMNGLWFGLSIVLMMLKFGFKWESVHIQLAPFLLAYVPMIVIMELLLLWSQQYNVRPKKERGIFLRARVLTIAAMPVYLWAFFAAVRDRGQHTEFEVTAKGGATITVSITPSARRRGKLNVFMPHAVAAIVCSAGLVMGYGLNNLDLVNASWAIFIIIAMVTIIVIHEKFELKNEFVSGRRRRDADQRSVIPRANRRQLRTLKADLNRQVRQFRAASASTERSGASSVMISASEDELQALLTSLDKGLPSKGD